MRFRVRLAQNLPHCPSADTEALSNACDSEAVLISLIPQCLYSAPHFFGDAPEALGRVAAHFRMPWHMRMNIVTATRKQPQTMAKIKPQKAKAVIDSTPIIHLA